MVTIKPTKAEETPHASASRAAEELGAEINLMLDEGRAPPSEQTMNALSG